MRAALPLLLAGLLGCASGPRGAPQGLPAEVRAIALHPVVNKTGQAGLEDALLLRLRDEFLRDGRLRLVPEKEADAVAWVTVTRYLNTPVQYDATLAPTAYRLRIQLDLEVRDARRPGETLLSEKAMDGLQVYASAAMAGGMSESQAQNDVWDVLARDVVKRVCAGR